MLRLGGCWWCSLFFFFFFFFLGVFDLGRGIGYIFFDLVFLVAFFLFLSLFFLFLFFFVVVVFFFVVVVLVFKLEKIIQFCIELDKSLPIELVCLGSRLFPELFQLVVSQKSLFEKVLDLIPLSNCSLGHHSILVANGLKGWLEFFFFFFFFNLDCRFFILGYLVLFVVFFKQIIDIPVHLNKGINVYSIIRRWKLGCVVPNFIELVVFQITVVLFVLYCGLSNKR